MVPIAGVPMIAYALEWLRASGVRRVAINLHYKPEPLVAFVGDGAAFGLKVCYSEEPELLGSAGALLPLRAFFEGEEPFVVLYGDVLTTVRLDAVLAAHRTSRADATLVLTRVEDPRRAGMVELGPDGAIRRLVEKPERWEQPDSWANAGIYLIGPRIWEFLPAGGFADFGLHQFPRMLGAGARLCGHATAGTVLDIGSHERLAAAGALVESGQVPRPRMVA